MHLSMKIRMDKKRKYWSSPHSGRNLCNRPRTIIATEVASTCLGWQTSPPSELFLAICTECDKDLVETSSEDDDEEGGGVWEKKPENRFQIDIGQCFTVFHIGQCFNVNRGVYTKVSPYHEGPMDTLRRSQLKIPRHRSHWSSSWQRWTTAP